jgi:hypothetical protein
MHDRWVVGYATRNSGQGRYTLARHATGDIAVFDSKRAAQCWADWFKEQNAPESPAHDTVLIRIPPRP